MAKSTTQKEVIALKAGESFKAHGEIKVLKCGLHREGEGQATPTVYLEGSVSVVSHKSDDTEKEKNSATK